MKQFQFSLPLLLLLVTNLYTARAKLFVYEKEYNLSSAIPGFEYPNNSVTLDVVWLFNHSIRLNINDFHLNGHSGDFVLISDLPLLNANDFKEMHGAEEGYVDKLAKSIVTDQGLLLSWKVNKTIEVINERGTFVLFHAEAKEPDWQADFKGFNIQVINYEQTITTTTTRAPDPYLPDPNGEETYITKYLGCKKPVEFLRDLTDFKGKIADIATNYCNELAIPQCVDEIRGNINISEVNVPDAKEDTYAGLHYCDSTWPNYETCVEVTFSITRLDNEGNYVLPANQLEQMWATKSRELENDGYCPYDPPEVVVDLNTIVWIAFFLGVILGLTLLLFMAWIKNTRSLIEYRRSFMTYKTEGNNKVKKVSDDKSQPKPHDPDNNPIYKIIPKTYFSHDQLYPSNEFLQVDEEDTAAGPFKKISTDNPCFEDVPADVYAYDNTVYEQDERLGPLPTANRKEGTKLYMRPRTSHTSLSDTEI